MARLLSVPLALVAGAALALASAPLAGATPAAPAASAKDRLLKVAEASRVAAATGAVQRMTPGARGLGIFFAANETTIGGYSTSDGIALWQESEDGDLQYALSEAEQLESVTVGLVTSASGGVYGAAVRRGVSATALPATAWITSDPARYAESLDFAAYALSESAGWGNPGQKIVDMVKTSTSVTAKNKGAATEFSFDNYGEKVTVVVKNGLISSYKYSRPKNGYVPARTYAVSVLAYGDAAVPPDTSGIVSDPAMSASFLSYVDAAGSAASVSGAIARNANALAAGSCMNCTTMADVRIAVEEVFGAQTDPSGTYDVAWGKRHVAVTFADSSGYAPSGFPEVCMRVAISKKSGLAYQSLCPAG